MLMPKKTKHRKQQKGKSRNKGQASKGINVSFGEYGLKSLEHCWITARQIESVRRTITKNFKKKGKVWIRIFPDKSVTVKGAETPMGKGKGTVDHYVAVIKPGMILFEVAGIDEETAKKALKAASYKLPVKTKFIIK